MDEELQLALALSKSEHEETERKLQAKKEKHDAIERERARVAAQQAQDADYALALELQERDQAKAGSSGSKNLQAKRDLHDKIERARKGPPQHDVDADYALAIQLQEQLQSAAKSPSNEASGGGIFRALFPREPTPNSSSVVVRAKIEPAPPGCCYRCRRLVQGTRITAMERLYCQPCFVCEGCSAPITGQFYPHEPPQSGQPEPYCQSCVRELFGLRCSLCDDILEGRFLKHAYFEDEKYCVFHEDKRRVCYSCGRLEPLPSKRGPSREGFVSLPDGRNSCANCIMTAVLDSSEARPLYMEAVDFMEHTLGLRIPPGMRDVPVLAVDVPSLNEQQVQCEKKRSMPTVRGLTMYTTTTRTTTSVVVLPPGALQWDRYTGRLQVQQQPQQRLIIEQNPTREVTAVLVLFGLPRDLTASILAHEAMHVYLKLSSNPAFPIDLQPQCEEGLCQVVAERYLADREQRCRARAVGGPRGDRDSTPRTSAESKDAEARDVKLREYFQFAIHSDRSEVYGDGFRAAHAAVAVLGLEVVLDHIKATKALPLV